MNINNGVNCDIDKQEIHRLITPIQKSCNNDPVDINEQVYMTFHCLQPFGFVESLTTYQNII